MHHATAWGAPWGMPKSTDKGLIALSKRRSPTPGNAPDFWAQCAPIHSDNWAWCRLHMMHGDQTV